MKRYGDIAERGCPPTPAETVCLRGRDRAGYALVLFVMLFFGLMGLPRW